jgi:CBS domain-containing protein
LILSKLRTVEGLKNEDSGQFINLELSKIDKEKLKKYLLQ